MNYSSKIRAVIKESSIPNTFPCFFKFFFNRRLCPRPGIYVEIFKEIMERLNFSVENDVKFFVVDETKEIYSTLNESLAEISVTPRYLSSPEDFEQFSYSKVIFNKEQAYLP